MTTLANFIKMHKIGHNSFKVQLVKHAPCKYNWTEVKILPIQVIP